MALQDQLKSTRHQADHLQGQVKSLLLSRSFSSLKLENERKKREELFNEISQLREQKLALQSSSPASHGRPFSAPLVYSQSSPNILTSPNISISSPKSAKSRPKSSFGMHRSAEI
ncbi:hypothetical protein GEMRC1_011796 [Eukaryota sp. GEM-RC1]